MKLLDTKHNNDDSLSDGKHLKGLKTLELAILLCKYGARTFLVQHFTGLNEIKIRALCHELGLQPIKGQTPSNPLWFAKASHRAEAIFFYSIIVRLMQRFGYYGSHTPAQVFLEAYRRYAHHVQSTTRLDINRAWYLIECIRIKKIAVTSCDICSGMHLVIDGDMDNKTTECIWCVMQQNRHCAGCGARHPHHKTSINLQPYLCTSCKSGQHVLKMNKPFTMEPQIAYSI